MEEEAELQLAEEKGAERETELIFGEKEVDSGGDGEGPTGEVFLLANCIQAWFFVCFNNCPVFNLLIYIF